MKKYVADVRMNETPVQANKALIRIGVLEKDGKTIAEMHRFGALLKPDRQCLRAVIKNGV